jgi:hypothetical protein
MTYVGCFPTEQMEHLRKKMPELAFRVLMASLDRLETIVTNAQSRNLSYFASFVGYGRRGRPLEMRFHDFDGNSIRRNLSFRREWEKQGGGYYGIDEAILMNQVVESLVLSMKGMGPAIRLHRNRHRGLAERKTGAGEVVNG